MASSAVDTELETLIRARYPIIYVVSWEEKRVEDALRAIAQNRGKKIYFWTITQGMALNPNHRDNATRDPIAALDFVMDSRDQALFVLKDFHAFIKDVTVTRRLRDLTVALKSSYKTLIVLAPILSLPPELEKEVTVVDYGLPDLEDLDQILETIIQAVKDNPQVKTDLTEIERDQIIKAAQGLTAMEAENVMAKSLVEKRGFDVDVILSEKEQIIRKSGILEYYPFNEGIGDVGGLDLLKDWMEKRTVAFTEKARNFGLPAPRGVLLLGVQGCGKSLSAKAIGALWRLPLLRLDVGRIFGGIVGQSEENMRKAIRVAESVAPCVAGDTLITLADGSERTIQSLYDGNETELEVLAMGEDWRLLPTRVQAITRRAAPDLFAIQTQHCKLQATSNHLHPVLRDGELCWVRTDELKEQDYIATPRQIPTSPEAPPMRSFLPEGTELYCKGNSYPVSSDELLQNASDFAQVERFSLGQYGYVQSKLTRMPHELTAELGYLLGLIASDGYFSKRKRIGFTNTNLDLHRYFTELLTTLFDVRARTVLNDYANKNTKLPGTNEESVFRPCYATYTDNALLQATLKNIQERILTLPEWFLKAWLQGYFDGDGYIASEEAKDPKIVITSKVPKQNALVRSVLRRVGFLPNNPGYFNIEITGYENVRRFIAQVGSQHPCKRERMNFWMQKPVTKEPKDRTDAIPIGGKLGRVRRALGMGSQRFASASSSLMHYYEHGAGHPNRERLRKIVAELRAWAVARHLDTHGIDEIETLLESPISWSKVTSVQPLETPEFVYDLVCEERHNFLAGGLLTHNCILWVDELEKGFSGTQSSGQSDGGTTSRVFGTFLSWMQDKKAATFVVATSNDVTALPPELLRKGRFDEIFFIDLPAKEERIEIFRIHIAKRKRNPEEFDLDRLAAATPGFSGAEIEAAVTEALYNAFDGDGQVTTETVLEAARSTTPLSMTMRERIDGLRDWAKTRARDASSANSEDMETIITELLVAKATNPHTGELDIEHADKNQLKPLLPPSLPPDPPDVMS